MTVFCFNILYGRVLFLFIIKIKKQKILFKGKYVYVCFIHVAKNVCEHMCVLVDLAMSVKIYYSIWT